MGPRPDPCNLRAYVLWSGVVEKRLFEDVDEGRFRGICQNALEGLAAMELNLEMPIERRARAKE